MSVGWGEFIFEASRFPDIPTDVQESLADKCVVCGCGTKEDGPASLWPISIRILVHMKCDTLIRDAKDHLTKVISRLFDDVMWRKEAEGVAIRAVQQALDPKTISSFLSENGIEALTKLFDMAGNRKPLSPEIETQALMNLFDAVGVGNTEECPSPQPLKMSVHFNTILSTPRCAPYKCVICKRECGTEKNGPYRLWTIFNRACLHEKCDTLILPAKKHLIEVIDYDLNHVIRNDFMRREKVKEAAIQAMEQALHPETISSFLSNNGMENLTRLFDTFARGVVIGCSEEGWPSENTMLHLIKACDKFKTGRAGERPPPEPFPDLSPTS